MQQSRPAARSLRTLGLLASFSCGTLAAADVIVDQADIGAAGYASQEFTDYPDFTCSVFDDVTLTEAYDLTAFRVYGENSQPGGGGANVDVRLRIFTAPDLLGTALATVSGTETDGVLNWDLTGITLGPGTYWFAAQVVRPFDEGGQWYWRVSDTMNGAHAMWHNPGGAFGLGTDPISTSVLGSEYHDMAMRLEGTPVPVPGAIAVLLGGMLARRQSRATR